MKQSIGGPAARPTKRDASVPSAAGPLPSRFYAALAGLSAAETEQGHRRRRALGLLQSVVATMQHNSAANAAKTGIHLTDLYIMALLRRVGADQTARVMDVQRSLGFTAGGMTRRLDKMIEGGLVERLPDPADGRAWLVRLTAHGITVADRALAPAETRNARLQQAFTLADWDTMIALLDRLDRVLSDD